MASYEDYADESERIQQLLERYGVDKYTIAGDSTKVLSDAESLLSSGQPILWNDSRRVVELKITEHNRSYGDTTRYTLSLTVAIPRQVKKTTVIRNRHEVPREQLSIPVGDEATITKPAANKRRKSRLTKTDQSGNLVPTDEAVGLKS